VGQLTSLGQKLYAEAGEVAEQSISSVRTVAAFTSKLQEAANYRAKLMDAGKVRRRTRRRHSSGESNKKSICCSGCCHHTAQVGINSGALIARGLVTVLFIIFSR